MPLIAPFLKGGKQNASSDAAVVSETVPISKASLYR